MLFQNITVLSVDRIYSDKTTSFSRQEEVGNLKEFNSIKFSNRYSIVKDLNYFNRLLITF